MGVVNPQFANRHLYVLLGWISTYYLYHVLFFKGLVNVKDKIRDVEGPDMKETMQDQIRQWFIECR